MSHRTVKANLIKISSWEWLHKAATNGTTGLLKSLGLTLASWNAIICNKSVHRASLYNFEKPSQENCRWSSLINFVNKMARLFSTWLSPCKHIVRLVGSFSLDYSFSHCHALHFSAPVLEVSLVQMLAWCGMQPRSCRALDWSSSGNERLLLLLPVLQQASTDANLEQPSIS